jgi:hypothetical protein
MFRWMFTAAALLAAPSAFAANCDAIIAKAKAVKGADAVKAWVELNKCDKSAAESNFPAFMKATEDVESLTLLALAAVDAKAYTPVWSMMDKLPDYSQRDLVAKGVGMACGDHAEVLPFLKAGYFGLRSSQFANWDDAIAQCGNAEIDRWLHELVQKPPGTAYDEKYKVIANTYVKRNHAKAIPVLAAAGVTAAKASGPVNALIDAMAVASEPDFDQPADPNAKVEFEKGLVEIAKASPPELAAQIADRLNTSGSTAAAVSLLPVVYADKLKDGKLTYGVAAVEICDKDAVVHFASVSEPAKRWSIVTEIEPMARSAFKPKLKCTSEWPVITSEPLAGGDKLGAWADGVVKTYTDKGLSTKGKEEKALSLP